jgi:hypothetical protein
MTVNNGFSMLYTRRAPCNFELNRLFHASPSAANLQQIFSYGL